MSDKIHEIGGKITELTLAEFDGVTASAGIAVLEFYADWCSHCNTMTSVLERFAEKHPDISVFRINTDAEPELTQRFAIAHLPTTLLFRDGKELSRVTGAMRDAVLEDFVDGARV